MSNSPVKRLSTFRRKILLSRLTLEPTCRQIALRMDATSPFPAIKRSDASDLARYPKMTESLVSLREKRSLALVYLENSENRL
jgi:hypothetical protein